MRVDKRLATEVAVEATHVGVEALVTSEIGSGGEGFVAHLTGERFGRTGGHTVVVE